MHAKSAVTMSNIISAAEEHFLSRSYADVTINQIAASCSLTKGAVYYHFPSKKELYLAMVHADLEARKSLLQDAVESDGSCRDRLRRLTYALFNLPGPKRELIQLIRRDINIFEESTRADLIGAYQASLPQVVESVIQEGIRNGELAPGDSRLLSWVFVALGEVVLTDYASGVIPDADKRVQYVLNHFFDGAVSGSAGNGKINDDQSF